MARPHIVSAILLCCLLATGSAIAQVGRDGSSGLSRDVFSRSRPQTEAVESPAAEFKISPFLEVAALSISFSIKGSAKAVAVTYSVTETAAALADEPRGKLPAAHDPADTLAGEELPEGDYRDGTVEGDRHVALSAEQVNREMAQAAAEVATREPGEASEPQSALGLRSFGDFPEGEGGTLHDAHDSPDGELGEPGAAETDGVEPQLDQPAFLDDARDPDAEDARLLSADGKPALAFDDGAGFTLPDGELPGGFDRGDAGGLGPGSIAGAPAWTSVRIPSSVSELSRGDHSQRRVALTFDDGPHPEYTEQILAILKYYDVPATFFFVGIQCVKYPQLAQQTYVRGHEIGSQTYDHFRLPNLPVDEKEYQIDEYQLLIKRLCGTEPRFLRPPGGQIDDQTRALLRERGIVLALWDVALNDTRDGKTAEEMLNTAKARVRPGSVILAHDGIRATVELLPQLIEELRRQGYEFVTMSELAAGL